ncbi:MAG: hypothetical protein QXZ31_08110 [Thermofilaceae archaeon]
MIGEEFCRTEASAAKEEQELLKRIAGKFILKSRDEALSLLESLPDVSEFVLFSNDYDRMLEEARRAGLEVVAEIPLVKAVVVRGTKDKLLRTLSLDLVEAIDIPRKVRALEA